MKQKRDRQLGLGNKESTNVDNFNEEDWFDGDDDINSHMVELENQGITGLDINEVGSAEETGTSEIASKRDVRQGTSLHGIQSNDGDIDNTVPLRDENKPNDVMQSDDVMTSDMDDEVNMDDDVTNSDDTKNHTDVRTKDDVISKDDVIGNHVVNDVINDDAKNGEVVPKNQTKSFDRVCGGHEVAIPIEKAVQQLDMKEEAIETLMCYLELHAKRWVQILKSIRSTCTLKFYGGPAHLHYVAQRVPVVTAAVSHARKRGEFKRQTSSLTFPIVKIVDEMGWDLEPVRRELYGLQWNEGLRLSGETGLSAGHSGIIVEFADLAFHVRAAGDLSGDEKDEVCFLV